MQELTVTAKIQVIVNDNEASLLSATTSAYRDACNYVSNYVYQTRILQQFALNQLLYNTLRKKYGLKSQMAQSVLKTVIAKYKTIIKNQNRWINAVFKRPQYDLVWNRDYSLTQERFSVNTLDGRLKLNYHANAMEDYFDSKKYRFGTAKLVQVKKKFYLHIPVTSTVEDTQVSDICHVVGIDRGLNFIAVSYDSKGNTTFFNGRQIKQKRAKFKELRRSLQKRGTASARLRIRHIGQRENRWMQDVNHCVSKALVDTTPSKTLFVLEDLTGIRCATEKVRRKKRYETVSWSFYDLEQKLKYKAMRNQSITIKVDPRYTSQCCPKCGHIESGNRDKKRHFFCCRNCGYCSNDDRIGAMNLYGLGLSFIHDQTVNSEHVQNLGVQSITPRCNVTLSGKKEAKGRRRNSRMTTGQLQANRL